jgi:hypothetical protein
MVTLPTISRGGGGPPPVHPLPCLGEFREFLRQFLYTNGTALYVRAGLFPSISFPNNYSGNMSFDAIRSVSDKVVTNKQTNL